MALYVLTNVKGLSQDPVRFPLLYDGSRAVHSHMGANYPLTVRLADGSVHPLLIGGLVSESEVVQIAATTAQYILEHHTGETILLVEILVGARYYSRRVVSYIQKHGAPINWSLTSIKVRSYTDGSRAGSLRIDRPLLDEQQKEIRSLREYEAVIVLDDLIDSGRTFRWIVREYLPAFRPEKVEACFMLEKVRPREPEVEQVLAGNVLIGIQVPDVWVVGYGPDITLPGKGGLASLHLCRGELPGGIYGFNKDIEPQLIASYHAEPAALIDQLRSYITER